MLIKFNSGHNSEAKSVYKLIKVPVPRPLRIPESGEIRHLSSFRKAVFHPSPLFATALQLLYLHNRCNSERSLLFLQSVVVFQSQFPLLSLSQLMLLCFSSGFLSKMAVSDVSQKYDVILRIFKLSKYQNILTFTV